MEKLIFNFKRKVLNLITTDTIFIDKEIIRKLQDNLRALRRTLPGNLANNFVVFEKHKYEKIFADVKIANIKKLEGLNKEACYCLNIQGNERFVNRGRFVLGYGFRVFHTNIGTWSPVHASIQICQGTWGKVC